MSGVPFSGVQSHSVQVGGGSLGETVDLDL